MRDVVRFFFAINSTNYLEGLINFVDISNIDYETHFLLRKNRKLDAEKPYFVSFIRVSRGLNRRKNRKKNVV